MANEMLDRERRNDGAAATKDQLILRYKPSRLLKRILDEISKGGPFCRLISPFISPRITRFVKPVIVTVSAVSSYVLFYIPFVFIGMLNALAPTHILLDSRGLRLRRTYGADSPVIPWDKVSYISLSSTKAMGCFDELLMRIHVSAKDMRYFDRAFFYTYYSNFAYKKDHCCLWFTTDGIAYGGQATKLHHWLLSSLPTERLDPQFLELLCPTMADSYTSLWLDALNVSPRRVRNGPLSEGCTIYNGKYEILNHIGSGGQGSAYLANVLLPCEKVAETLVVLKEFILPVHGGNGMKLRNLENIEREADLLKRIVHPQIVRLLDFFVEDHRAYLVLEHIEGVSLRQLIEEKGSLSEEYVCVLAIKLCKILEFIHDQSPPVIHRDFTPDNIIVASDGMPKLIDFNVAQQLENTSTKTVVGKHCYIPPEQFRGRASIQSDIYAFGATLYFLLTGEDPEPITASHPRHTKEKVSEVLDHIVAKATAPNAEQRCKDAATLKSEIIALSSAACEAR